ncbi:MAG: SsrA-binding protein SmpB [Phycisphaerales bacterium]
MAKKKDESTQSPTIENRRARFDYHIEDTLECGIALMGSEIKSVRASQVSLNEGYVHVGRQPLSLTLLNVNIGEYAPAGALGHRPLRARTLLAHRREMLKIAQATVRKGMTVVPLKLYFKDGWAKVLVGVAKGKDKADKRRSIGEREAKRDIDRAMSRRR